jgi:arabinose-5-phosphate isomerase
MGDALAMCLLELNEFEAKDFAKYHPGGNIGKLLFQTTKDLIVSNSPPCVSIDDSVKNVINEISSKRLGATAVIDKKKIVGIITDGDIRRMLENYKNINELVASEIMSNNPIKVKHSLLASDAIKLMNNKKINHLIVVENSEFLGIVNILDFTKEGIN